MYTVIHVCICAIFWNLKWNFWKTYLIYVMIWCMWSKATVTDINGCIFQSSSQRDFVVMATRTPQREESAAATGDALDKEWVTEHARQVSVIFTCVTMNMGVTILNVTLMYTWRYYMLIGYLVYTFYTHRCYVEVILPTILMLFCCCLNKIAKYIDIVRK